MATSFNFLFSLLSLSISSMNMVLEWNTLVVLVAHFGSEFLEFGPKGGYDERVLELSVFVVEEFEFVLVGVHFDSVEQVHLLTKLVDGFVLALAKKEKEGCATFRAAAS